LRGTIGGGWCGAVDGRESGDYEDRLTEEHGVWC
jgi:hypothetical protein